jgi:MFS family permease
MPVSITKNLQYYKFCFYGFLKNLRFFDAFLLIFFMDKGLYFSLIGVLYAIREIALAIFEIPSGVIADALGRRKTLVASFFFYILSFVIFYLANQFFLFAIAMLLFAFGDAFRTGVHKAMIYHYLKVNNWSDQKINYYGHTRSWSQVGTAVSALAAGLVVFLSGDYRIIFLASIIPYLLDMLLILSYPKYLDGDLKSIEGRSVLHRFKQVTTAFFISFKKLVFIRALTSNSLYTGFYRAIKDYIQPLLKYFALTMPFLVYLTNEEKVATIVGIIYFITYLLTAFASHQSGRFAAIFKSANKPLNATILLGLFIGILTGIAFRYGFFVSSIFGFVMLLIIENLRKPIGVAVVADLSQERAMATVLSTSSQAKSIIAAILAPMVGFLADLFDPGTAIAAISILLIFSFPLYWLKEKKS